MASVQLRVTGMTCGHCQQTVEDALKKVKGVYAVLVDLQEMTAEVDFDESRSTPEDLTAAVERVGYGVQESA
jgi:copper chaperone